MNVYSRLADLVEEASELRSVPGSGCDSGCCMSYETVIDAKKLAELLRKESRWHDDDGK